MSKVVYNNVEKLCSDYQRRQGKRFTVEQWSKMVGISESTFKNWKYNGTTRFDGPIIIAFTEFFGIGIEELLSIEEVAVSEETGEGQELRAALGLS